MYHAYNVIKYLTGDYYSISTIEEDIIQTVKERFKEVSTDIFEKLEEEK